MPEPVHIVTPARLTDVMALAPRHRRLYRATILQRQKSQTLSIFAGDTLLGVAMLFPEEVRTRELCLLLDKPAAGAMLPLVRLAQLTLARIADSGVVILARIKPTNAAGRRMARLVGFLETDAEDGRLWIWRGKT